MSVSGQAQVTQLFETPATAQKDSALSALNLKINYLGFVKNNEYFNLVADGYTLLGHQLNVRAVLQTSPNYKLYIGGQFQKYMGLETFEKPVPYLGLEIYKGNSTFYFGKLNTTDNHYFSDILYDFERYLDTRHIENGLQHRFKNEHWQTDTWLQWEHFIFKGDNTRERLNFGQSTTYQNHFKNWNISLPLRLYIMHRGGQINVRQQGQTLHNNAMVILNYAAGIALQKHIGNFLAGLKYMYFGQQINSDNTEELHFKQGYGQQIQILIQQKNWQSALGYWQGHHFVAPKGNPVYQSISYRVEKFLDTNGQPVSIFKNYTEPRRQLLTWQTMYKKEIFKNLWGAFVLDMYYQLNRSSIQTAYYSTSLYHQFDYATGLYLQYKFDFKLLKIK